ncbi:SDR family NAD(P)-dependent oxidoreductase [Streptomyces xiamenensis]|uniref:SDR family NAD(P)-dependent oxidoreductase n=1 Tax=Streptomyces TaxID=1883 RepID=UPI0004C4C6BF|nr:SDR family oxidoreductase [Streptomyces sp. NRRL F-2890]
MIDTGLSDSVVLVTGAHRNIGREIALAFAEQGAAVAVHYYAGNSSGLPEGVEAGHYVGDARAAEETVARLREAGAPDACAVAGDLGAPDAPRALLDAVEARLGPAGVLVNNAAHTEVPDGVLDLTAESLHRNYTVNTFAPALLTAELARRSPAGAAVVNISTDAARAFSGQLGYGTSKAALEAFTRAAAIDLGPRGVRVNAVAPGPVQTGWMSPELIDRVLPDIPLRRVGTPRDIADAVVFLASRQATWITGQVIQVAGGHVL